jgi:hypothetical protein
VRLIYAGEESAHAHDGFVDRICVCLLGGRLRSIDPSVVTVAGLSFEVQPMSIWNSYISGACPPSNSYGVKVQFPGAMKWSAHPTSSAPDLPAAGTRQWSSPVDSRAPTGSPRPGAVLSEIGLLLGIHLAVALAVTLILQMSGIV